MSWPKGKSRQERDVAKEDNTLMKIKIAATIYIVAGICGLGIYISGFRNFLEYFIEYLVAAIVFGLVGSIIMRAMWTGNEEK